MLLWYGLFEEKIEILLRICLIGMYGKRKERKVGANLAAIITHLRFGRDFTHNKGLDSPPGVNTIVGGCQ